MPVHLALPGLVCASTRVCVSGGQCGGSPWNEPQQALDKAQLCPTSHLTKPCFLCLWDFGLVHARLLFTTESPWHPNTAFHYFTFQRVRIWPLDWTCLRFPVWFCIHVYIYMKFDAGIPPLLFLGVINHPQAWRRWICLNQNATDSSWFPRSN